MVNKWLVIAVGVLTPIILGVSCTSWVYRSAGPELFGVCTIIWAFFAFLGLFDFGMQRVLMHKIVVDANAADYWKLIALQFSIILGAALAVTTTLASAAFISMTQTPITVFPIQWILFSAAVASVPLAAWARAIQESRGFNSLTSATRVFNALFSFVLPPLIFDMQLGYSNPDFFYIFFISICIGRCLCTLMYISGPLERIFIIKCICWRTNFKDLGGFLLSGGWWTVSLVSTLILVYADKFVLTFVIADTVIIGGYVIASEMSNRMMAIPTILLTGMMPALMSSDSYIGSAVAMRCNVALMAILFPIGIVFCLNSSRILEMWMGHEFALEFSSVFIIYYVVAMVSSFSQIFLAYVNSRADFKTPALLHLAQVPFFGIFYWVTAFYVGVLGLALAVLLRVIFDLMILIIISIKIHGFRFSRLSSKTSTEKRKLYGAKKT